MIDFKNGLVEMAHGSGGRAMATLIDQLFISTFNNETLNQKNDQAVIPAHSGQIVMATDSHVISPLFFPGGDIGSLAVHGTINDVAMSGAVPHYLSVGFILEEGFPLSDLKRIVDSMAEAAAQCQVKVVTGDTKVVEKGHGDGVYINTTGIGYLPQALDLGAHKIQPGDKILLSGSIGDHGLTILSQRQKLPFTSNLISDSQPLHDLVKHMMTAVPTTHCMRDPTRGGVAATLNELCDSARCGMMLYEKAIPVKPAVSATAELLGLDPLYIANEGKLIALCGAEDADLLLATMRSHPAGKESAIIGEVLADDHHLLQLKTAFGGNRLVDWRYSDPLPRIC